MDEKRFYVLKCVELYIKDGGFTKDIKEAKRYPSFQAALKDRVTGWVIKEMKEEELF